MEIWTAFCLGFFGCRRRLYLARVSGLQPDLRWCTLYGKVMHPLKVRMERWTWICFFSWTLIFKLFIFFDVHVCVYPIIYASLFFRHRPNAYTKCSCVHRMVENGWCRRVLKVSVETTPSTMLWLQCTKKNSLKNKGWWTTPNWRSGKGVVEDQPYHAVQLKPPISMILYKLFAYPGDSWWVPC